MILMMMMIMLMIISMIRMSTWWMAIVGLEAIGNELWSWTWVCICQSIILAFQKLHGAVVHERYGDFKIMPENVMNHRQHSQPGSGDDVSGGENTGGGAGPIGASRSYT